MDARIDIPDHAPHVLVVDDDRRLRDLLARFLTENGYRITTAASAAEARAKSESVLFDALGAARLASPPRQRSEAQSSGRRSGERGSPGGHPFRALLVPLRSRRAAA